MFPVPVTPAFSQSLRLGLCYVLLGLASLAAVQQQLTSRKGKQTKE